MVWVGKEPHISMHIYSRELHAWVLNISDKSFQSFPATTAQSDHVAVNWQAAGCLFKMLDICLSLGFMVAQGNSRVFYCTSLVLQSMYLVLKPSKIMQNKTVDHGLTHHAARCNCSVFVQDKPGNSGHPPCVRAAKILLLYGHLGQARKGQGSWLLTFIFQRQFTCFPKHEECCWELKPRNTSLDTIHLSGKQGVMGKVLHSHFPVGKKVEAKGQTDDVC